MTPTGDSAPAPAARPAFAVIGIGAVVALSLAHPSSTRMLTWPWAAATAIVWALPVLLLLLRLAGRNAFVLPSRAVTAGLALLAIAAVASAATSPFAALSLARTWPTLGGVAFYFLLHDSLARSSRGIASVRLVAFASSIVIAVSAALWINAAAGSLATTRNAYPFGHSNYTGGFIVLALPWFAQRAWTTRSAARIGWLLVAGLALFALAGTSSRGAVLALVAVGGIAALVVLVRASWSRRRKLALAGGLVALAAIVILANPRLRDLARRRSWSDAAAESNRQRAAMLRAGEILGAERPLLGWGPGTVPLAYPRVRAQLDGGVDDVLQLHNTPVQIWATLGVAGLIASALGALGAVSAARRGFPVPFVPAACASLGGYALFALTDHQLDLPALNAFVAFDLALITASGAPRAFAPSSRRLFAAALTAVACLAPTRALLRDLQARQAYDRALTALETGQPLAAITALDAATQRLPSDSYFQHQAAGILLGLRDITTEPARRRQLARDAAARLEASLATGAYQEFAHFNLGWLYLDTGDFAASARHFRTAAQLVPDKGGVYFGLGLALQSAGRTVDATRAFALECISDPRSLTSPAWEVPALAALKPAIRAETMRLYAELAKNYPRAAVAAAWTRWWTGENVSAADLEHDFTRDAADFVAALPALAARQPVSSDAPWAQLYEAWRENKFSGPTAAALTRRAQRHAGDFVAFLRAGSEDEATLVRTYRRARTGYGVLALHPDGPPLTDHYIVQELAPLADFAAPLFPPKGWLPGRFLLALLPPDTR